jgi:hypothetical protein
MPLFGKRKSVEQRNCEYCGERFEVRSSWKSQKFCSKACYAESIRRIHVTKEELEHWYFDLKMTSVEIAEKLGCNDRHVREIMSKFGITLRNKSEAAIHYPCYPFSGDLVEKAYLIGFRLGDLNVFKDLETSQRICARSGTTVPEQVELIRSLFEQYGHINFRQGTIGETQIECRLDLSFEFLLAKEDRIPKWAETNDAYFWAFAAGYADAEGHIASKQQGNNNDAVVEIQSCDLGILQGLEKGFNKRGVTCSLSLKFKAGMIDKRGTRRNCDFYRLAIFRHASLDAFFRGVSPYLKHADKVARMTKAWKVVRQ